MVVGRVCPKLALLAAAVGFALAALGAVPAGAQLSTLKKGDEIDLRNCTYGEGVPHAGRDSGQYFVDRNAFYAGVFLPTDLPGGHYRFHGLYPHARWFSFESYDESLASEGVVADDAIDPDPGSPPNPFLPGHSFGASDGRYTVDVQTVPAAQRQNPPPHNVLYMGYRMNPTYGRHSAYSPVIYRVYAAPGTPQGDVPLPHLAWVVDDPATNPFQTEVEACHGMDPASAPNSAILQLNQILDRRVTSPTVSPAERNVDIPTDDVPRDPPYVSVLRPASNGYQGAYFNSKTPYVYLRPSATYGRFLVIHFKAPTYVRIEDGQVPTGNEQTRYWSWCAGQFVSPVNVTQACLYDKQFHLARNGYATLVISPPEQRPVIGGTPYPDWMPWPGGGADLNMRQIDPNPNTFHQSPFFMPLLSADDGLDYLKGPLFEDQIKAWMGPYFPQIKYCTTQQFQQDGCGFVSPDELNARTRGSAGSPRATRPAPSLNLRLSCRGKRAFARIGGRDVRAVRRARFYLGRRPVGSDARRPFARSLRLRGRPPYQVTARVRLRDGSTWTLDGTLTRRCGQRSR
jgi:hypothetical protein